MKKRFLIIIFVLIFSLSILIYAKLNSTENKVCFNENCFNVELAKTKEETSKGLMNREFLDKDSGMLFIFPTESIHSFWMKNTLIPLDIIWISKDLEVLDIKENFQPCTKDSCETYSPNEKSLYVLELNAGTVNKTKLKKQDKLVFSLI